MKLGVIGRYSSEFLKMAKEIGYGYVEISARDFIKEEVPDPGAMAEEVRKELEELGLSLSCFGAYDNFLRATEEEFEGEVEKIRLTLELAEILGAPVIRVYGGRFKEEVPKERWKDLMVEGFKRTLEYAEPQGIKLALDNHGRTTNDAEFEVEVIRAVGSENMGANVDTSNFRWFGHSLETVKRFLEMLVPYTLHTHLKDGDGRSGKMRDYTATALGEGEIDVAAFMRDLAASGYQGVYTAEYEAKEPRPIGLKKNYDFLVAVGKELGIH